jgi:phage-related protein
LRLNNPFGPIARIFFCAAKGKMVLLHGFIEKIQKTPAGEMEVARARQNDIA